MGALSVPGARVRAQVVLNFFILGDYGPYRDANKLAIDNNYVDIVATFIQTVVYLCNVLYMCVERSKEVLPACKAVLFLL